MPFDLTAVYPRAGMAGFFSRRLPVSVEFDLQGMRLTYSSGKSRSWPWSDSPSWLILIDAREWIRAGAPRREIPPFKLTWATLDGICLTEAAGMALLEAAKAAGKQLVKQHQTFPYPALAYADPSSYLTRVGHWAPA